jgi:flagellar protein FliS
MSYANMNNVLGALQQYGQTGVQAEVSVASPHRIIQMLMQGALDKIAVAKGCIERRELAQKSNNISWAASIINGLRMSLDKDGGGEIAVNLDGLYDYMHRRLMEANSSNDVATLDEVSGLMKQIKDAWDVIGEAGGASNGEGKRSTGGIAVNT